MTAVERPASIVMVQVGERSMPYKYVPSCHTCQSPWRLYIEREIILGSSIRNVAAEIVDFDHEGRECPGAKSIAAHMRNHIPLDQAKTLAIYDDRLKEVGESLEEAQRSSVDHITAARLIVQRGTERMLSGEIQPDVKDVIAAASALAKIESDHSGDAGLDFEIFRMAFQALLEITEQYLPINAREGWRAAIKRDPLLNQIREQIAAAQARERLLQGEVQSA